MTKRAERLQGLGVIPKRWLVDRTFGWLHRSRRLRKDDEDDIETSEAMLPVAMIPVLGRRLARIVSYETPSKCSVS